MQEASSPDNIPQATPRPHPWRCTTPTHTPHLELWIQVGIGAEGEHVGVQLPAGIQRHFLLVESQAHKLQEGGQEQGNMTKTDRPL